MTPKSSLGANINGYQCRDDRPAYDELTDAEKRAAQGRDASMVAQLDADRRNFDRLAGDMRLVRLCRAYFHANEAGKDRLAELAAEVMAATVAEAG